MYLFDKLVALVTMLCRVFAVTPDSIKAVKDKGRGLPGYQAESVRQRAGLGANKHAPPQEPRRPRSNA